MKHFSTLFLILISSATAWGQYHSEDFVPRDAVTVLSINNISLLKKVSMDELVQYEFMTEVQAELFDGSTSGKTLKDSGIDFDEKLNVFYGQNESYEVSGFSFGIVDQEKLFVVFDDFERQESSMEGVEVYSSYFNHLIIKGNVGLVLRVDPSSNKLSSITDSIWLARGNGYFYDEDLIIVDDSEDGMEILEDPDMMSDEILDEGIEDTITTDEYNALEKTYWEINDSLQNELQQEYFQRIVYQLYEVQVNLKKADPKFALQLTHSSDGIFYLDNSRNYKIGSGMWDFRLMFPELYTDLKELYSGNVILGDVMLNEETIDIYFEANYGEALGAIYEKLNGAKFDKNALKYIHQDATGYFTYNINLKEGYKKAYDVVIPLLSKEKDPRISSSVLLAQLINEFVDTDALFDTYKGSMFGSFNGIKKVKTKRIEFIYDEETFEYDEQEIEGEEEMPIFTMGFSTDRNDIPQKVLEHLGRITSRFKKMDNYWLVEDAIFNSVPLYIINKNNLLIFTNDEDLAINHSSGYGAKALGGKRAKKAKKSKFMYAYFDWSGALDKVPAELFTAKQNEILGTMRDKTGVIEMISSKTTKERTTFHLTYSFEGNYENSGKYLLDLVNSVYVLSK